MATATLKKTQQELGPRSAGIRMSLGEFDRADFVDGYRYELINGVLVVSPIPLPQERSPNEQLVRVLLNYQEDHPQGSCLNATLPEHTVNTPMNRRRADRVIWAGFKRRIRPTETPTIIAEFVSSGKRSYKRDYEEKRDEYLAMNVKEYWVIDRFERTVTVFTKVAGKIKSRTLDEKQTLTTPLLPGFEVSLAKLFAAADKWADANDEE